MTCRGSYTYKPIKYLFNHKGGVGKTTLVPNLGFILADQGQRVLLIDADPQMNLTAAMYGLSTSKVSRGLVSNKNF
jgi:cellulose biosynthesis protein BcsQ